MSTRRQPGPPLPPLARFARPLPHALLALLLILGLGLTAACAGPGEEAAEETAASGAEEGAATETEDGAAAEPQVMTEVPPDLMRAFARLDRHYIPALASTNRGDREVATATMDRLLEEWERFDGEWGEYDGSGIWGSTLETVERQILEADALVDTRDGDLLDAHKALEEVRLQLWDLRRDLGAEYYLDRLTAFHEVMEEIVRMGQGDTEGMDRDRLRELTAQARQLWAEVDQDPPDPHLFGLGADGLQAKIELAEKETEALDRLSTALEGDDGAAIRQAARGLKPPFAELYTSFGDRQGLEPGSRD